LDQKGKEDEIVSSVCIAPKMKIKLKPGQRVDFPQFELVSCFELPLDDVKEAIRIGDFNDLVITETESGKKGRFGDAVKFISELCVEHEICLRTGIDFEDCECDRCKNWRTRD